MGLLSFLKAFSSEGIIQKSISAISNFKNKKIELEHTERMQKMLNSMKKEELVEMAMESARKLAVEDARSTSWFAKNIRPIGGFIALFIWVFTIYQRSKGIELMVLTEADYRIIYTILGFYYGSRLLEKLFGVAK